LTSPFQIYGPFQFDRKKIHNREYRNAWWEARDGDEAGLPWAKGVYLLSLKNKYNYVPQYVGITKAQGFYKEVFREGNLLKVAHDLSKERGSFQIHLVAKPKASHSGFSDQIKHDALKWLERLILFSCLTKNPGMLNKSHRVFLKSVGIGRVTGDFVKGPLPDRIESFMNALATHSHVGS
jgi:hypothetical protein